jgi:cellulose synthase operon protein C
VGAAVTPALAAPNDRGRTQSTSLRSRLAFERAQTLLTSEDIADRVRALERLGGTKAPRAIERLIVALQPGSGAPTAEERLTAVRELSFHSEEASVRRALARVVGGHAASSNEPNALDQLSQATAALSLSRAGTPDALAALAKALSGGGAPARAAKGALVAYPPRKLGVLLAAVVVPTEEFAEALAELADQRGFETLRALVRRAAPEVKAKAAVGLTELGDYETVLLARAWVHPSNAEVLRIAGARILVLVRSPEAGVALRSLLDDDRTWRAALALVLEAAPTQGLAPSLSRRLAAADAGDEAVADLIAAIGRGGGADAVQALERELGDALRRPFALDALRRMPDEEATRALERALGKRELRRLAALALAVRRVEGGAVPATLEGTLRSLETSQERDDRVSGAICRALLEPRRIPSLLRASDVRIQGGGAALLNLGTPGDYRLAAALLPRASDRDARTALAFALSDEDSERFVPTETLLALVDDKSPATPLAARALSARDEERTRASVDALVESSDPTIRFHAMLGLGRSSMSDASGRLAAAYRFEVDSRVRWAVISALSHHSTRTARRTLEIAAALDPDEASRSAARLALGGAVFGVAARGRFTLFSSAAGATFERRPTAVKTPDGLTLPSVPGPDGLVLGVGLPSGSRVAPGHERGKDEERGASGEQKDEHTGDQ